MIENYRLFIYEELDNSVRKEYWNQIKDKDGWKPITDELYNDIEEEGWIEDLEFVYDNINKENIIYKELDLSNKDKEGLISFDDDIINDFNSFDIEIKDGQEYPFNTIDFIDYNNGIVYIVKYNK
jgi:hypothetical protein